MPASIDGARSFDSSLPRTPSALRPGDTLAGRYELIRLIGEGGMGVVWQAKQLTTDKPVAIKLLRSDNPVDIARFLREAKVAAGLSHPNIVQVFDFWETPAEQPGDSVVFMVMELLVGEPLSSRLERAGNLSVQETLELLTPVARALRFSHAKGVVHRDLKPDNVFLVSEDEDAATPNGESIVGVKVVDFGLAKPVMAADGATAMTQSGAVLGTPRYMAPEMVYGEDVDLRADLWALGIILYQCLVGRPPFEGDNFGQVFRNISRGAYRSLHEAAPNAPEWLAALVTRMLSHDRDARPNAIEVVDALERCLPAGGSTVNLPGQPAASENANTTRALPPSAHRPPFASTQQTPPPHSAPIRSAPGALPAAATPVTLVRSWARIATAGGVVLLMLGVAAIVFFVRRPDGDNSGDERPTASIALPPSPNPLSARSTDAPPSAEEGTTSNADASPSASSSTNDRAVHPLPAASNPRSASPARERPAPVGNAQKKASASAAISTQPATAPAPAASADDDPLTRGRF